MLKNIKSFIFEDELQIHIYKNKVNIINYSRIGHFDNNKVIVYKDKNSIIIKGEKIFVSRLMIDELLIEGIIKSIEFR